MAEAVVVSEGGLGDASPAHLARALAWKSAAFGARQSRKAVRRLPAVAGLVRRQVSNGPLARVAENGYSLWSIDSRWSFASLRSHSSAWSVWSLWSAGSVGSLGSVGSVGSIGSAGSLFSIGSVGSILSIGSAGSVLAIGGYQVFGSAVDDELDADGNPSLTIVEQGGTLIGVLALFGAGAGLVRSRG